MNKWKYREETFFKIIMWFIFVLISFIMISIVGSVMIKGISAINWSMVSQSAIGGFYLGKEGGILHAITGSLFLAGSASLLAAFFSIPIVLYLNIYSAENSRFASITRFMIDVLSGIPSIVCGMFFFVIMMYFSIGASLLGGIIAITILVTPVMCRSLDEISRQVPGDLIITSYSLGATKLETGLKVFLRQIYPGIFTSFLLAFGRGIGDAAAVLFTAGFTDNMPSSLFKPAATLPLTIFFQLEIPIEEVRQRAYASAFILTVIILAISIISRLMSKNYKKYLS
jgi:phosphate transport system permease protein